MNTLKPGLYRVHYKGICAGLEVRRGMVVKCAPVLKRRLSYWLSIAEYLGPLKD